MLEADLDASPRTLRFFVDDREQPVFVSHIPQTINFTVCIFRVRLLFTSLQVTADGEDTSYTLSLREVAKCDGRGLPNSVEYPWGATENEDGEEEDDSDCHSEDLYQW
jgi:hypothetical protein